MDAKEEEEGGSQEGNVAFVLSALDVRRLKVVTLCFVTFNVFIEHCCWAGNGSQGCRDNDPLSSGPGKSHGRRSLVGYSPWGC